MDLASRFDAHLARLPAPLVQEMAKTWGIGKGQVSKSQSINTIIRGLNNVEQIQRLLAGLKPYERLALAVAKLQGGEIAAKMLMTMLQLLEIELPDFQSRYGDGAIALAENLVRRGIFIPDTHPASNDEFYHYGPNFELLVCDERILAHLGEIKLPTISLSTTTAPEASSYRRPASVVLTILGFMQAIADLDGIKLTKSGTPQANSLRKLMKSQHWEEEGILVDGFWFPQPTLAMTAAFAYAGVLMPDADGSKLVLASPIETFANHPYPVQIGQIMLGFSVASEWTEWKTSKWFDQMSYIEARRILLLVLKLLPSDGWYSLDDLTTFLFDSVGDRFSLTGFLSSTPQFRIISSTNKADLIQRWQEQRQQDWQQEKHWFRHALATWLYLLGIVELGFTATPTLPPAPHGNKKSAQSSTPPSRTDTVISFRLTDLGRILLQSQPVSVPLEAVPQPAWIVQPNFEILVYLDEVAPSQMIFLDRYAERIDIQQHTAQYRLTRESVYQGLERGGTSLLDFLRELRSGAKVDLPQNVEIDLQQWGGLREQITLRRTTRILEFIDAETMQAAIAAGLQGRAIGDRFVLLDENTPLVGATIQKQLDYNRPLEPCLTVTETGEVRQTKAVADLLIATQLQRWMEARAECTWILTQASVSQAAQMGNKANDILDLLETRLTHPLPPLLKVALSAWAGKPPLVEMAEIIVLRCTNPDVFKAIATSKKLRSHFVGQLAPDLLLVQRAQLKKLERDLASLGIQPVDHLQFDF